VHQQNESLWVATTPETSYPAMRGDAAPVDVVVIGGGITGLTAAALLREAGQTVAVIEAGRIASGTTGNTTAKITALHRVVYQDLIATFGLDRARAYAEANVAAMMRIAQFVNELAIDCDYLRMPAYTYTEEPILVDLLADEAAAAQQCGLPAMFLRDAPLPFPVAGSVVLDDQACFHPRKYALALAFSIVGNGSHIYENTRALDVREQDGRVSVETDHGVIECSAVIIATLTPFPMQGMYFARTHPERAYVIGCRLTGEAPRGMYISMEEPTRSIRTHDSGGETVLLVSGENHKVGQDDDTEARYRALEEWARERFEVASIDWRWSAQDFMPVDGIPYVGRMTARHERAFVATGFKKWGMTNGTAAAMILADLITGRPNPWASTFDSTRVKPLASAKDFLVQNVDAAVHLVGERLKAYPQLDDLDAGEAGIVNVNGERLAVYKEPNGATHAVGAKCTHMGCYVHFNKAEKTWDCPCHGSRFDLDGRVIQGPATKDLESRSITERTPR
jgi:glycine/D-amino acid oxidase-like deaminating enzyme/nitrite reductase/ring-hydroxylating ferredoxin subunit